MKKHTTIAITFLLLGIMGTITVLSVRQTLNYGQQLQRHEAVLQHIVKLINQETQ